MTSVTWTYRLCVCVCVFRRFVEKDLCKCISPPERHDLRYFPTVNDIKNHIHESQKALGLTTTAEVTHTHFLFVF